MNKEKTEILSEKSEILLNQATCVTKMVAGVKNNNPKSFRKNLDNYVESKIKDRLKQVRIYCESILLKHRDKICCHKSCLCWDIDNIINFIDEEIKDEIN